MKLKTERDLSCIDPLTVEFFQNNRTSSISVILLTNGRTEPRTDGTPDGRTNGRNFNTSLAEVIKYVHIQFTGDEQHATVTDCLHRQATKCFSFLKITSSISNFSLYPTSPPQIALWQFERLQINSYGLNV